MAIYTFNEAIKKHGVKSSEVKSLGLPTDQTNQSEVGTKGGFVDNLKSSYSQRNQNVFQAKQKVQTGQQNIASGLLQSTGQVAGLAGDVVTGAVGAMTPQPVKDVASSFASSIANTEPAQKAMEAYEKLKQSNPEAVANLEAVFNISTLIPALKGGQIAGQGAKVGLKTVGKATKATAGATKKLGQGVSGVTLSVAKPENIMQRVARIPKGAQAKFEKTSGESIGKYLNKRDIYGNTEEISQKLYDRFSKSKDTADKAIAELPGNYKPSSLRTALKELLNREKRVSSPGALSPDFKRTRELANKFSKEGLTMSEINEAKRLFEKNVRLDFVKQNLPEGVARATNIDNALRQWQFSQAEKLGLKNLPDINKETRLAKQLLDAIGKETAGSAGNNALTLTDYILLAGGDPTAIGAFIGKKTLSAKGVQSAIAKKLYSGEKVGMPEAQKGKPRPDFKDLMSKYNK